MTMPTKGALIDTLRAYVNQRPGMDFANYGDAASYRSDYRQILANKNDAHQMLSHVASDPAYTAELIWKAQSGSGRLQFKPDGELDYCVGQYWCMEYRAAVCSLLSGLIRRKLYNEFRPDGKKMVKRGTFSTELDTMGGLIFSEFLHARTALAFGCGISRRWFNHGN